MNAGEMRGELEGRKGLKEEFKGEAMIKRKMDGLKGLRESKE